MFLGTAFSNLNHCTIALADYSLNELLQLVQLAPFRYMCDIYILRERERRHSGKCTIESDMGVVTPLNNPGGPEGDTVTVAEKLLNTEY